MRTEIAARSVVAMASTPPGRPPCAVCAAERSGRWSGRDIGRSGDASERGDPHDERPGVDPGAQLGDATDDVAVHLHVLAALHHEPHLLRAGVVDAADLR